MKLHSIVDCITNSSSTTFIIGLPKFPETAEELQAMLFPTGRDTVTAYDDELPAATVAKKVFQDLFSAKKITTKEKFLKHYQTGWFPEYPEFEPIYPQLQDPYSNSKVYEDGRITELNRQLKLLYQKYKEKYGDKARRQEHEDWQEEDSKIHKEIYKIKHEIIKEAAKKAVDKHWEKFKALKIFILSYADDDFFESILEQGDLFDDIAHIRISNH